MLFEEKSNLARLMATENLFIEERNVQTAYFDLKTRVLTIPILDGNLSSNLYDLLLGHEVSHALETPYSGWHDSIIDHGVNKSILNVCEDARIEKKIKRKFPGIRSSFIAGYQELVERNFFQIKNKNIQKMNLIDRINLYTKVGSSLGIEFTDEEKQLVKEVENTESFDDVVIIAKKIQQFMREQNKNAKKFVTKTMAPSIEDDGDTFELDSSDEDDTDSMSSTEITEDDESDSKKETSNNDNKNKPSGSDSGSSSSANNTESGDDTLEYDITDKEEPLTEQEKKLLESVTDKAFRNNEKELFSKNRDQQVRYLNIPKINKEDVIVDYKVLYRELDSFLKTEETLEYYNRVREIGKEEFLKYKKSADSTISYLVKEFELRKNADQQSRVKISKSGEINVNKVHEYSFTDDIFKRMTKIPNGKSHGLVLYLDWSGSMQNYIHQTIKQVINIVLFCRKCNIPFEVYAFSNHVMKNKSIKMSTFKPGDIVIEHFSLFNLFTSRMNNNDFTKACTYMYNYLNTDIDYYNRINFPHFMNLSSTPLNEAIISAFEINSQFKLQNKLDIVNTIFLTDGDGHSLNTYRSGASVTTFRQSKNDKVYIRDLVTKTTFLVKESSITSNKVQTNILMRLLKKRLNCKIVGFMIVSKNDIAYRIIDLDDNLQKKPRYELANNIEFQEIKKNFNKNKYHIITNSYADEFYLLKSNALDTDDEDFDDVEVKSMKSLSSAFSKYNENKIQSRVLLNRFINLIS